MTEEEAFLLDARTRAHWLLDSAYRSLVEKGVLDVFAISLLPRRRMQGQQMTLLCRFLARNESDPWGVVFGACSIADEWLLNDVESARRLCADPYCSVKLITCLTVAWKSVSDCGFCTKQHHYLRGCNCSGEKTPRGCIVSVGCVGHHFHLATVACACSLEAEKQSEHLRSLETAEILQRRVLSSEIQLVCGNVNVFKCMQENALSRAEQRLYSMKEENTISENQMMISRLAAAIYSRVLLFADTRQHIFEFFKLCFSKSEIGNVLAAASCVHSLLVFSETLTSIPLNKAGATLAGFSMKEKTGAYYLAYYATRMKNKPCILVESASSVCWNFNDYFLDSAFATCENTIMQICVLFRNEI